MRTTPKLKMTPKMKTVPKIKTTPRLKKTPKMKTAPNEFHEFHEHDDRQPPLTDSYISYINLWTEYVV